MIITVKSNADKDQLNEFQSWLTNQGYTLHPSQGANYTLIGVIGDTSALDARLIEVFGDDEVEHGVVQALVVTVLVAGEAALDEGDDQGQEVVRQARALNDQGGQRQVGRSAHRRSRSLEHHGGDARVARDGLDLTGRSGDER